MIVRRALAVVLVLAVIGGGVAGGLTILSGEPNEIRTTLEPQEITVAAGETFTVELTIENVDLDSVTITGIGIDQSLLDGMSLEQMDPGYRAVEERNYPVYGHWSEYKLNRAIFDGDKLTLILTFRAKTAGQYSGDVSAWVETKVMGLTASRARRAVLEVKVQ
jgi:hypothetical protein